MSLGIPELTLIVLVIVLLFGAKRIPELARSLGQATGEYKKAKSLVGQKVGEIKQEIKEAENQAEKQDI